MALPAPPGSHHLAVPACTVGTTTTHHPFHILRYFTFYITLSWRVLLARQLDHPSHCEFKRTTSHSSSLFLLLSYVESDTGYLRRQIDGTLYTVHRRAFLKGRLGLSLGLTTYIPLLPFEDVRLFLGE